MSDVDRRLPAVRGPSAAHDHGLKLSFALALELGHPDEHQRGDWSGRPDLVTASCGVVGQLRRTHSILRSAGVPNHPGKRCLKCCARRKRWRAPKETIMGRRLLVRLILVTVLLTVAIPAGTASAKPGAMVLRDIGCGIDLNGVPPFVAFTDNARIVATPSGRAVLVCHAEIPTGPSSAVIIEDLPCFVGPAGVTDQSHTVITPSGKVLLTCHLNRSDLAQLGTAATLGTASGATRGRGLTPRPCYPARAIAHQVGLLGMQAPTRSRLRRQPPPGRCGGRGPHRSHARSRPAVSAHPQSWGRVQEGKARDEDTSVSRGDRGAPTRRQAASASEVLGVSFL
jgi:hypothetical protein